jgi:hypothetical protein
MHDTDGMRGGEPFSQLQRKIDSLVDGGRAAFDALAQFLAIDEFHDEKANVGGVFETVDTGDVGVLQSGERSRFAIETRQSLGVSGHLGGEDLDGDIATELAVAGTIYLTHAAFAERAGDFIVRQGITDQGTTFALSFEMWPRRDRSTVQAFGRERGYIKGAGMSNDRPHGDQPDCARPLPNGQVVLFSFVVFVVALGVVFYARAMVTKGVLR